MKSRVMIAVSLICLLTIAITACGDGNGGQSSTEGEVPVTVKMKADFETSEFSAFSEPIQFANVMKIDSCPTPSPSMDEPGYEAGLDCDEDGGIIRYITPSSFKVAFKRLTFVEDTGDTIEVIPDTGTLENAIVYDLTSEITVSQQSIPAGNYSTYEAEIYYYEIQMEINNPPVLQTIRVYLSDDDFPAEGNLGHHQGDITFINSNGDEIGWVPGDVTWEESSLQSPRGDINGAGGTDPETGHLRGLYGNAELWNQPTFMQGSNEDIYLLNEDLCLTIENKSKTITFSFDVKDTWFYEDFDDDQTFNPCDSTYDACAENAEWSPIVNEPDIIIE